MERFTVNFQLAPPGLFGLPEGDRVVIPVKTGETRKFVSPVLDVRTGRISGHGTLSEYRQPSEAIDIVLDADSFSASIRDNFLSLTVAQGSADQALTEATERVGLICNCLAAQFGVRVWATPMGVSDARGEPVAARHLKRVPLFSMTAYNLPDLDARLRQAIAWARVADDRARKALLYFEHASLLKEAAINDPSPSTHTAFTLALAFLQMFKALVTLVGEPTVDPDYQSRATRLGLPRDFWQVRVRPLYRVRNDDDVAHYSLKTSEFEHFLQMYPEAFAVFREAITAYLNSLGGPP